MKQDKPFVVLAGAAHPDDIEFMMAGTLLLLRNAGAEIHIFPIANGSCGSMVHSKEEIIRLRREEAEDAARVANAIFHPPLVDDLEIIYKPSLLRKVTAVIRDVRPNLFLVSSPDDYMEDHQNACRLLLVSGTFARGDAELANRSRNGILGWSHCHLSCHASWTTGFSATACEARAVCEYWRCTCGEAEHARSTSYTKRMAGPKPGNGRLSEYHGIFLPRNGSSFRPVRICRRMAASSTLGIWSRGLRSAFPPAGGTLLDRSKIRNVAGVIKDRWRSA